MINDIFAYATRHKLRFSTSKGELSVEQLWDVPLRSKDGFDLNAIAKLVNMVLKDVTEENFVEQARTPSHTRLEVLLELVKHVISAKLADEDFAKKRVENKAKKDKLLSILDKKQDEKLDELSVKELQKQIAALDTE